MLKDYYNEIIPPWDSRYGKLGHIWKKYKWDDLVIPGKGIKPKNKILLVRELVLDEYPEWRPYVARNKESILMELMDLTEEEYFLITVYKVNRVIDKPRCPECHNYLDYNYRFNSGYWTFCSRSCNASWNLKYQFSHLSDYPSRLKHLQDWYSNRFDFSKAWEDPTWRSDQINRLSLRFLDPEFRTKFDRGRFIHQGELNDKCYLYLAITESYQVKLGVTIDIDQRLYLNKLNDAESYLCIHQVFASNRSEVANLEAQIKLRFNGNEYLDWVDLHRIIHVMKELLANRPVANPFE